MTQSSVSGKLTLNPRQLEGGPRGRVARLRTIIVALVALAMVAGSPWVLGLYELSVLTQILVYSIAAVSLQLLWGRGGQLSFGHAAFFGIGAYGYSILSLKLGVPTPLAFLLAILITAVIGLIIGYFLFFGGVRGAYFSVITLAIALVVNQLAISVSSLTGGNSGLIGVPGLEITVLGAELDFSTPVGTFFLSLSALAVTLVVVGTVHFSRLGLVFTAIREDETRASFMGYNTSAHLTALLVISVSLAGLAGAVFSAVGNYAAPDMLGTLLSIEMLTWVAIGGRNYVVGALLGVFAIRLLNIEVSSVLPTSWPLVIGGFFVLVVLFLPAGLVGFVVKLARSAQRSAPRTTTKTSAHHD